MAKIMPGPTGIEKQQVVALPSPLAAVLKQHKTADGWHVMLAVGGKPVTLRFDSQPGESALNETLVRLGEQVLREVDIGGEETDVLS